MRHGAPTARMHRLHFGNKTVIPEANFPQISEALD